MYTKEQEEIALKEYERLGSIAAVIHWLGYLNLRSGASILHLLGGLPNLWDSLKADNTKAACPFRQAAG